MDSFSICDPEIRKAVSILANGGIAVYPTETFYALGGDPYNDSAVNRIFDLKGRDLAKPLPLIASDRWSILRAVSQWPGSAEALAKVFWPGPLTLLLPASPSMSPLLHAHTGRLAVRISPHPVARHLAEALGGLIISTSANLSGEPAGRSLGEISRVLLDGVDVVVSGGELEGRQPSTIVDLTVIPPRPVREGAIPWEEIRRALGS
ncbi:MAG: L-threonylcarbamoyladenylate synthase [Syntrophobacteraceae bacterium]|nr:L-threonylcarbamoyladenylate synthase [Syntrophobacteraceae bacterium]